VYVFSKRAEDGQRPKQVLVRISAMLISYSYFFNLLTYCCVDESVCFASYCGHHVLVLILVLLWTDNGALVTSKPCGILFCNVAKNLHNTCLFYQSFVQKI
jgi:hypothetical protein